MKRIVKFRTEEEKAFLTKEAQLLKSEGKKLHEIAEQLNVPVGSINHWLGVAKKKDVTRVDLSGKKQRIIRESVYELTIKRDGALLFSIPTNKNAIKELVKGLVQ